MSDVRRRTRSRHHRRRRALRWVRALGPILLLIAAGLLSAGVVHVVEVGTPVPVGPKPQLRDAPGPDKGPRRAIDLERFDQELYRELQNLDTDDHAETSFVPRFSDRDLLYLTLSTSHLGARFRQAISPFESEIRANVLFEGPDSPRRDRGAFGRTPEDRRSWAPEPGTGLLVFTGLSALARRSLRPI